MSATDPPRFARDPDAIDLPREIVPPADLENRVTQHLLIRGLLRRPRRGMRWALAGLAAAACFAAGILTANVVRPAASSPGEPRFLLLLYSGTPATAQNVDREASARAHIAWLAGLRQQGRTISGERLAETRELIGFAADAPPNPPLEGFFVVAGASMEDAVRVARSSPHVGEGGRIVVQRIDTPR